MDWKHPQVVASFLLRFSIGVTMVLIGIITYRDFAPFVMIITDGLGFMTRFAHIWSYFIPGFFIISGGLLVVGRYSVVTAWIGGLALGSLPIGLVLKTVIAGLPLTDMLGVSFPAVVWLSIFMLAVYSSPDMQQAILEERDR